MNNKKWGLTQINVNQGPLATGYGVDWEKTGKVLTMVAAITTIIAGSITIVKFLNKKQ